MESWSIVHQIFEAIYFSRLGNFLVTVNLQCHIQASKPWLSYPNSIGWTELAPAFIKVPVLNMDQTISWKAISSMSRNAILRLNLVIMWSFYREFGQVSLIVASHTPSTTLDVVGHFCAIGVNFGQTCSGSNGQLLPEKITVIVYWCYEISFREYVYMGIFPSTVTHNNALMYQIM